MAYTETHTDGNTKTTIFYTSTKEGFGYTIIGDNIKGDFNWLTGDMYTALDEFMAYIRDAAAIQAFNFNDAHHDISVLVPEIEADVNSLKGSLETLKGALIKDIDNVNAELKVNFGYWVGGRAKEAGRSTETVSTE